LTTSTGAGPEHCAFPPYGRNEKHIKIVENKNEGSRQMPETEWNFLITVVVMVVKSVSG
jgi:hypothetical protein